jgi:hypothetical protein
MRKNKNDDESDNDGGRISLKQKQKDMTFQNDIDLVAEKNNLVLKILNMQTKHDNIGNKLKNLNSNGKHFKSF